MRRELRKLGGSCTFTFLRGVITDECRAIERCNFDRARLIRHNRILAKNGIAPDGKLALFQGDPQLMSRYTTR
jgi:hypothetical protein